MCSLRAIYYPSPAAAASVTNARARPIEEEAAYNSCS